MAVVFLAGGDAFHVAAVVLLVKGPSLVPVTEALLAVVGIASAALLLAAKGLLRRRPPGLPVGQPSRTIVVHGCLRASQLRSLTTPSLLGFGPPLLPVRESFIAVNRSNMVAKASAATTVLPLGNRPDPFPVFQALAAIEKAFVPGADAPHDVALGLAALVVVTAAPVFLLLGPPALPICQTLLAIDDAAAAAGMVATEVLLLDRPPGFPIRNTRITIKGQ
jgi:hypothetical protein